MPDPHKGAISLLENVPFDEEEIDGMTGSLIPAEHLTPCEHSVDVEECVECFNPNRIVKIKLSFKYKEDMYTEVECELIYETTFQAMVNSITVKDSCGATTRELCNGNSFVHGEEYFWCTEHLGEYDELKLSDLFVNSDFDVGMKPLIMMKTGSKEITLKEITFREV